MNLWKILSKHISKKNMKQGKNFMKMKLQNLPSKFRYINITNNKKKCFFAPIIVEEIFGK